MTERAVSIQPFQIGWYGDSDLGEELIQAILSGRKTATTSPSYDRSDTSIQEGDTLELLDKQNRRRGMLRVTRLEYRLLRDFDEELAADVGTTLEQLHERVRLGNAREIKLDEEMRVIHFALISPPPR